MPVMSAAAYAGYRWRLAASFVLRLFGAGIIIYVWDDLEGLEKVVAIGAAVFVVPGLSTIKRSFRSYEQYLRESAPKSQGPGGASQDPGGAS